MIDYIHSQLFGSGKEQSALDRLDRLLQQFESDNKMLQQEIQMYECKIQLLPQNIRKKIFERQTYRKQQNENIQKQQEQGRQIEKTSPKLSNQFEENRGSKTDKKTLQTRLAQLKEQQEQIDYISAITDNYIRCKKQYNTGKFKSFAKEEFMQDYHTMREKINHQRLANQQQEMEKVSKFLENLHTYHDQRSENQNKTTNTIINEIIEQIKLHTGKKLIKKCENLIHLDISAEHENIIIETYLIKNCRQIILASVNDNKQPQQQKSFKIINNFIEKILSNIIYYDVSYQKIILLQVENEDQNAILNKHHQTIKRKRMSFAPNQTDKHLDSLSFTMKYHVEKVQELRELLFPKNQGQNQVSLVKSFDKITETYISTIKSTLEYILPFLNIKSRKQLMEILTHGKQEMVQFQDLVLRLKFKGQDGDMFMNNLDSVFNKLFEIRFDQKTQTQIVIFNDKNFDILTSFFELGISQAEQSLLESSSKAIKKFTINLSKKIQDKSSEKVSLKHNSKKILNMIFFSVSNLVERFDVLLDQKGEFFSRFNQELGLTYEDKIVQWAMKLIEIRERVRVKIHQE